MTIEPCMKETKKSFSFILLKQVQMQAVLLCSHLLSRSVTQELYCGLLKWCQLGVEAAGTNLEGRGSASLYRV